MSRRFSTSTTISGQKKGKWSNGRTSARSSRKFTIVDFDFHTMPNDYTCMDCGATISSSLKRGKQGSICPKHCKVNSGDMAAVCEDCSPYTCPSCGRTLGANWTHPVESGDGSRIVWFAQKRCAASPTLFRYGLENETNWILSVHSWAQPPHHSQWLPQGWLTISTSVSKWHVTPLGQAAAPFAVTPIDIQRKPLSQQVIPRSIHCPIDWPPYRS